LIKDFVVDQGVVVVIRNPTGVLRGVSSHMSLIARTSP